MISSKVSGRPVGLVQMLDKGCASLEGRFAKFLPCGKGAAPCFEDVRVQRDLGDGHCVHGRLYGYSTRSRCRNYREQHLELQGF